MSDRPVARVRRIVVLLVACALAIAVVFTVMNQQLIQDKIAAASFEPTPGITKLEQSLQLTPLGSRVFLASHPTLDGSQRFNEQCAELLRGSTGHVLGCYVDNQIHLFDVTDARVAGIVEVTAAHELLHAGYARLQPGDRSALAEKLRKLYQERKDEDPDLAKRMEMYAQLPDAAFAGELHSVFGSEVGELPDWLEEHYKQWFTNRAAIVATYRSYKGVFQGLESEATTLRDSMQALRADIETRKGAYESARSSYEKDLDAFNKRVAKREFSRTPEVRTAQREALEKRRDDLNTALESLQKDIDQYNTYRSSLEQIGELSAELEDQLDSALAS